MNNIVLQPIEQEYINFMAMPPSLYKNIFYNKNIKGRHFSESTLCYVEDVMHYSYTNFLVKKSKTGFYRSPSNKKGFTFEKGKIRVWFGKSILEISLKEVFDHFNMNWLDYRNIAPYLTKSVVEKILLGKLTNNIDVVKAYMKTMHIKASPKLFYEVISQGDYTNNSVSKQYLLRVLSVAKDHDHALIFLKGDEDRDRQLGYILNDMIEEAAVLNKKIDFNWSPNRMKEEHTKMTREIMAEEIKYMQDEKLEWLDELEEFTAKGFTLLKSALDVFQEGTAMKHCLYTGYYNFIKAKRYVAYSVDIDGERATVGYYIYPDADKRFVFNQCYGIGNSQVSDMLKLKVMDFEDVLNSINKQLSFTKNDNYVELI